MYKRGSIAAAIFLVVLAFAIIGTFMIISSKNSSSGMAQIAPDEWTGIPRLPAYLPYESPYAQCTSTCMPGGVDYYHCLQSCDAFSSIGNAYAVNPSLRRG